MRTFNFLLFLEKVRESELNLNKFKEPEISQLRFSLNFFPSLAFSILSVSFSLYPIFFLVNFPTFDPYQSHMGLRFFFLNFSFLHFPFFYTRGGFFFPSFSLQHFPGF